MRDKEKVAISYDREADVMYLSFQDVEAEAEEIEDGIFARYNPQGSQPRRVYHTQFLQKVYENT
ncbi:MAG: DUF2283 domain-containing protein [Candidatus Methanomethylicaceae archaeon]